MLSYTDFENEYIFVQAFVLEVLDGIINEDDVEKDFLDQLRIFSDIEANERRLATLFRLLSKWCHQSQKPIVLLNDEADSATNNQIFLDFLAQLRGY